MNPFLPGDQGIPYPPVDIPTPETPAPDFFTVGADLERGKKQAEKEGDPSWLAWIPALLSVIAKWVFGVFLGIITWFLRLAFKMFGAADSSMNELAAVAVQGLTGVPVSAGSFASLTDRSGREDVATGIANIFTNAMRASVKTNADGMITPTDASANKFMQMGAHMAIEGWLQGWIVELCTWDKAERFADLKDTLEQTLGIGRLARRAMAAPMKVLVEDPYTQLMNQTYHPTLLAPGELVREYLRNALDRNGLQAQMDLHGYTHDKVDALINTGRQHLSPADIFHLYRNGYFAEDTALTTLHLAGWDSATATQLMTALNQEYTDSLNRQLVNEALALYKARKITKADFDLQVSDSGLPKIEQDILGKIGQLIENGNRTGFKMAEGELLVKKGLWTLNQFRDLATYHGYQLGDESDLELLLLVEIKDAADAAAKKAAAASARQAAAAAKVAAAAAKAKLAAAQVEEKGVSQAQYETLVEQGLRTLQQYHDYLTSKQVAPDNADALVTVLQNKMQTKAAAAALKAAAAGKAKAKNLDVAQLETAVKQGLLTVAEFTTRMEQAGMSATDAQLLAQELQGQMDSAATKAKAAADAKAAAAVKHVDLSQEERAVRLGIETPGAYAAFLDAHGFDPHSRDVLVSELQAQLGADKQTAAKKAAAAAKLAAKGISLPQLERLVRAGVKTTADYTAALATAGYDAADQAAMTDYLKLQMEQDQQDLILHGHAAALVGELGVSLADLERAVKLSVVPIATYQDALKRAGLSAADQQTLVQNLAAEIKTTRAAQSTTQSVSKQVAAAGVTLSTLERDTISGKLTIEQFQGLLAGYGVAPADVLDVVALVQDEIDNAAAVKALVNQATARAAAKGLDLAQDTAAYKAGVMTEEEWRSRVASLGYDAADVEILFETLAAAQAATAAKSAAKKTAPAATTAPAAAAAGG